MFSFFYQTISCTFLVFMTHVRKEMVFPLVTYNVYNPNVTTCEMGKYHHKGK